MPRPDHRTPSQRLAAWLPPCYQHLSQLPDYICEVLVPLAVANTGCGLPQVIASYNLKRLAAMTPTEVEAAYDQLLLAQATGAA